MHRVVKIEKIVEEAKDIKSFYFHDDLCSKARPGQFIMVWIPGVDEIPMSLSRINVGGYSSITVLKVGDATSKLHKMRIGDQIGIKGPFGNGFSMEDYDHIAFLAGGSGAAPILAAVYHALSLKKDFELFLGARSSKMVPFINELRNMGVRAYISTDDGSLGYHGTVIDLFNEFCKKENYDLIVACGPEKMLYKVALLSEELGVEAQISLERYMKCGLGVCGTCSINGYLVCKDGPVFNAKVLLETNEFGRIRRKGSGAPIKI
ncbi:MAG: dihydroorotate dehydrogenase electron transfer subunit [Thermoplasmata archaeon]|nr:MAG: dihydroorotate dehydrogenase electron transfer subunit [Thermoplasmata archaeon]